MREIKFRVWHRKNKKWYYFTLEELVFRRVIEPNDLTHWSQFTGLKDKNGKEIYEGDIVRCKRYQITDSKHEHVDEITVEAGMGLAYSEHLIAEETLGNIYENPELLNSPQPLEETV